MATVVVNRPDLIEFKNISGSAPTDKPPTLNVQAGIWQIDDNTDEAGIVFEISGNNAPLLNAADARKLARWLTRAADDLEGAAEKKKQKPKRQRAYDDNEDEYPY